MAASFFCQLSSVARKVEKETQELQNISEIPLQQNRRADDCHSQRRKAVLVLKNIEGEIEGLKKDAKRNLMDLRENGFMELISAAKDLIQKEKEVLLQAENYLQQYGFQPLTNGHTDSTECSRGNNQPDQASQPETTINQQQARKSVDVTDADGLDSSGAATCGDSNDNTVGTPGSTQAGNGLSSTPKLEDFGLSKDFLATYKARLQTNPESDRGQPGNSQHYSDEISGVKFPPRPAVTNGNVGVFDGAVPDAFDTTGICVTPGYMQSQHGTFRDNALSAASPALGRKAAHGSKHAAVLPKVSDEWNSVNSPIPPVLATPGIKQIQRHNRPMQGAPMQPLSSPTDSPVPPVLQTPGMKQIVKHTALDRCQPPESLTSLARYDTPEMPELTVKFDNQGFARPAESAQAQSLATHPDSPAAPVLHTPGVRQQYAKHTTQDVERFQRPPESLRTLSNCDTPEMPELTLKFDDIQLLKAKYTTGGTTKAPVNQVHPRITSSFNPVSGYQLRQTSVEEEEDDNPFPTMPELTGTYNFTFQAANQSGEFRNQSNQLAFKHIGRERKEVNGKENIPPATSVGTSAQGRMKNRIPLITDDEYKAQPDYVIKSLSLEQLNKYISSMQQFIHEGHEYMTESDVNGLMGHQAKFVLLVLTRLDRLTAVHGVTSSQPAYRPKLG